MENVLLCMQPHLQLCDIVMFTVKKTQGKKYNYKCYLKTIRFANCEHQFQYFWVLNQNAVQNAPLWEQPPLQFHDTTILTIEKTNMDNILRSTVCFDPTSLGWCGPGTVNTWHNSSLKSWPMGVSFHIQITVQLWAYPVLETLKELESFSSMGETAGEC